MATHLEFVVKTNQGNHLLKCPASWYSTTTELYQDIIKRWKAEDTPESTIQLFAIVTGEDELSVMQYKDANIDYKIKKALSFIYYGDLEFEKLQVPTHFKVGGRMVMIPKELGNLTAGQNLLIKKCITNQGDLRAHISYAIAVYLQPLVNDKPINLESVLEIEKEIKQMPITSTYALGTFFLKRLKESGQQPQMLWLQTKRIISLILTGNPVLTWLRLNCLRPIKILISLRTML